MNSPGLAASAPVRENVGRLKSELRRNAAAMAALRAMGVNGATADRLHLGIKPPYRSRADGLETRDALCFPLLGEGLVPLPRYAYLDMPGVTVNPQAPVGWGPGAPMVYRLGSFSRDALAIVATDVVDAWIAFQLARGSRPDVAFLSRSKPDGWPSEWRSTEFWSGFSGVLLLPGAGSADFLQEIAPRMGRPLDRVRLPAPYGDLRSVGCAQEPPPLDDLVAATEPWTMVTPAPISDDRGGVERLGRFEAAPVSVVGAFSGGWLYYPFAVEERTLRHDARGDVGTVVHSYETMVLRSDGRFLTTELLPAPRGTPVDQRILVLSDGTRILAEPVASRTGTWSFASIRRYAEWHAGAAPQPFRSFGEILADVETFLRSRVWLPVGDQHLVVALYVALSHLHQVFDAIPLLLVVGDRGTGKSELGEAVARLSFNATVAGQLRAAGMIRLLDETRGLLVLDDMDGDGSASVVGNGELAQALKTSYRRGTSRKPVADRGGRVRMIDFFGPKVISSTRGVDAVLGSRMLAIVTAAIPDGEAFRGSAMGEEALDALRDELHCWAMASVEQVAATYRRGMPHRDRRREIEAPLAALAEMAGGDVPRRLRATLDDPRSHPVPRGR